MQPKHLGWAAFGCFVLSVLAGLGGADETQLVAFVFSVIGGLAALGWSCAVNFRHGFRDDG